MVWRYVSSEGSAYSPPEKQQQLLLRWMKEQDFQQLTHPKGSLHRLEGEKTEKGKTAINQR